jgi:hypothetical protein
VLSHIPPSSLPDPRHRRFVEIAWFVGYSMRPCASCTDPSCARQMAAPRRSPHSPSRLSASLYDDAASSRRPIARCASPISVQAADRGVQHSKTAKMICAWQRCGGGTNHHVTLVVC